jgi:hypothetical protein
MRPAGYYRATKLDDKINEYYDAAKEGSLNALKAAYEEQTSGFGRAADNLKAAYDSARNVASADSAIANYNLNQRLAGANINTGAGSQARLSQQNALMKRYSELDKQNLDQQRELEIQQANLQRQYQAGIADAIHKNQMDRAKALYDEAVRYDNSFRELPTTGGGGGGGGYPTQLNTAGLTGSTLDIAQNLALAKQNGAGALEILQAIGAEHSAGNIGNRDADEITRRVLNQNLGDTSSWNVYSPRYWQGRIPTGRHRGN